MKFNELPLHAKVLKGIVAAGFEDCTEVQEKVLPVSLQGKDLMVQSKTGSGKTAVYALTILQRFAQESENKEIKSRALVVAPTRELAVQIEEDFKLLASGFDNLIVGCFYGGVGYEKQEKLMNAGCNVYVGTPGRLLDFQKSGKIDFAQFDVFVLDEADRMFDMGFYPDVQQMFSKLKACTERQTMLFSATLSTKVRNLAWSYMNEAKEIEVEPEEITVDKITQELYHVAKSDKFQLFLQLMAQNNPTNALVFTNTKAMAVEVSKRLTLNGYPAKYLMGDMPQSKRLQTLEKMKDGSLKFLVATDVAARGLQIDDLELVVNYDIPEDFESYVHRIGRTARAGNTGKSITLADEQYIYGLEPIENYIQMKIPVIWPEEGSLPVVEDKSKDFSFRDLVSEREYSRGPRSRDNGRNNNGRSGRRDGKSSYAKGPRTPRRDDKRPRQGRDAQRQSPRNQNPRNAQGQKTEFVKPNRRRDEVKSPQNTKKYDKIQTMTLDERLAYYKKEYINEGGNLKTNSAVKAAAPKQDGQRLCQNQEEGKTKPNSQRKSTQTSSRPRGKGSTRSNNRRRNPRKVSAETTETPKNERKGRPTQAKKKPQSTPTQKPQAQKVAQKGKAQAAKSKAPTAKKSPEKKSLFSKIFGR